MMERRGRGKTLTHELRDNAVERASYERNQEDSKRAKCAEQRRAHKNENSRRLRCNSVAKTQ
jgi:hypothetical protein